MLLEDGLADPPPQLTPNSTIPSRAMKKRGHTRRGIAQVLPNLCPLDEALRGSSCTRGRRRSSVERAGESPRVNNSPLYQEDCIARASRDRVCLGHPNAK